jgi:ABC-type Na+ efflux pump permease subunit
MNNAAHQQETGVMKVGSSVVLCEQSSSETGAGEKLGKEESSSCVSMPTQDSLTVDNSALASTVMEFTQSLQQGTNLSSAREALLVSENVSVAHQDVTSTSKLTTAGVEEMETSEHQSSENPIKQEITVFFLFCFFEHLLILLVINVLFVLQALVKILLTTLPR